MDPLNIKEAAQYIYESEKYKREIVKLTQEKWADLTVEEAYLIQRDVLSLREADGHT